MRLLLAGVLLAAVGVAAFFLGRTTAPKHASGYHAGFLAGHEDAFGSYDGGWGYGELYVVTLRRGATGETYQFANRWPMMKGVEYRVCSKTLCSRPAR